MDGEASLRVRLDELHQHGNLNRRQDERDTSLEDSTAAASCGGSPPGARSPTKRSRTSSRAWVYTNRCRSPCWSPSETAYVPDRKRPERERHLAMLDGLCAAQERLTGEAQRYIGRVTDRHVLGAGGLDEEEFGLRKEAVELYLSRFVSQLTLLSPEIDELLRTLDGLRISVGRRWCDRRRHPPPDETGDSAAEWRARQHTHWQGLLRWYVRQAPANTVDRLRAVALDAVTALTRGLRPTERRPDRRTNRAAAFLQAAGGWRSRTPAQRIGCGSRSPGCTRHGICPFPRTTGGHQQVGILERRRSHRRSLTIRRQNGPTALAAHPRRATRTRRGSCSGTAGDGEREQKRAVWPGCSQRLCSSVGLLPPGPARI